ncbi:MAG: hypothetical protein KBE27_03945 [Syntrophorhabdaceae bacterium]|nr:hypothetical protein [Syntrophorhabdales bacterium]MBP9560952.1 hypothetical protein [Syntrophorhabdaceae bacterium]
MNTDEWGMDPQVRFLRRVFSQMELAQRELLQRLNMSPLDERLRRIRDGALKCFEKAWGLSVRWDMTMDEKDIVNLYIHALAHILERYRVEVPPHTLPNDEKARRLIQEAVK